MSRLESKTLGETANYGINLMEISTPHLEADSSCSPQPGAFAETYSYWEERSKSNRRERRAEQGHFRLKGRQMLRAAVCRDSGTTLPWYPGPLPKPVAGSFLGPWN